jgi:hypothetical protein
LYRAAAPGEHCGWPHHCGSSNGKVAVCLGTNGGNAVPLDEDVYITFDALGIAEQKRGITNE